MRRSEKQELKEKTDVVKKILDMKGKKYEDWLLEVSTSYISENVSFLISMVDRKEVLQQESEKKLEGVDL